MNTDIIYYKLLLFQNLNLQLNVLAVVDDFFRKHHTSAAAFHTPREHCQAELFMVKNLIYLIRYSVSFYSWKSYDTSNSSCTPLLWTISVVVDVLSFPRSLITPTSSSSVSRLFSDCFFCPLGMVCNMSSCIEVWLSVVFWRPWEKLKLCNVWHQFSEKAFHLARRISLTCQSHLHVKGFLTSPFWIYFKFYLDLCYTKLYPPPVSVYATSRTSHHCLVEWRFWKANPTNRSTYP